jgi:predicted aspartyl protease
VTLALDTGSTFSVINPDVLLDVGVEIEHGEGAPIATASGVVKPRRASVTSLAALGHIQNEMVVLAHPLARELRIDGLLGLDFLRGRSISIDFRVGTIDLD